MVSCQHLTWTLLMPSCLHTSVTSGPVSPSVKMESQKKVAFMESWVNCWSWSVSVLVFAVSRLWLWDADWFHVKRQSLDKWWGVGPYLDSVLESGRSVCHTIKHSLYAVVLVGHSALGRCAMYKDSALQVPYFVSQVFSGDHFGGLHLVRSYDTNVAV